MLQHFIHPPASTTCSRSTREDRIPIPIPEDRRSIAFTYVSPSTALFALPPPTIVSPFPSLRELMHDAGEKDTPPSDRLVVARKPLLPAPYARFYSSTRFRSVSRFRARLLSSPSKLFELSAILVAPPLPAARSRPYRSSPIETCSKTRAHYSSILESSSANLCFDRSLFVLSAGEKCRL